MSETSSWVALFDWDGVVIDSASQHEKSWELLAEETGHLLPPDHFLKGFGMRNEVIIPQLLQWTTDPYEIARLSARKEHWYRDLVRKGGVQALPGVEPYLRVLKKNGVPAVIASSTHRANIQLILEVLGFDEYFCGMVTSEDVGHGKPDPEVFLKAAAVVEAEPQNCIVFEDAVHGIQAGIAVGMKFVGVTTTHVSGNLPGAHRLVDRLDELGPGRPVD